MRVFLFYLSDAKYGGWPTFTCHLALALKSIGVASTIVRIGKRSYAKPRSFGRGVNFYYASLKDAVSWAHQFPSIVVVAAPGMAVEAQSLVSAGCRIALHDPTELKGGHHDETIRLAQHPVIITSRLLEPLVEDRGGSSVFMLHPYTSIGVGAGVEQPAQRPVRATCVSRVDFDKNTDVVIAANALLPENRRVAIYGGMNRLYAFHKLDSVYPGWRANYRGEFSVDNLWSGSMVSRTGHYAVDMSIIVGDGGRTQYTFLEAWDAGATTVLHRKWLTGNAAVDEVAGASLFVSGENELADTLQGDAPAPSIAVAAKRILARHAPEQLADELRGLIA
jgi:hypothetical protein